jgi:hypothetical protein
MTVHWAQKLQHLKDTPLRGLRETGAEPGNEFLYLKDVFELGAHSQLFVGMHAGQRRIFKCVSALPSHSEGGLRHAIAIEKKKIAKVTGRSLNETPWQEQGTMASKAIHEEINAVHACKSPFAKETTILATRRAGVSGASKYFYVMPPAPTDLLGCIHALQDQTPAMRRNIALMALGQLATQLHEMHVVQSRAHRDIRSENILCNVDPSGVTEMLLWDFGLAISGDARSIEPWVRQDMYRLGKVFAMLLAPDLRTRLEGPSLPQSQLAISARFFDLAPILQGLLEPRPEHRWSAQQLLQHLEVHQPQLAKGADVRKFMPTVHPIMDTIDEKWAEFEEARAEFG